MLNRSYHPILVLVVAAAPALAAPSARLQGIDYRDGTVRVQLDSPATWRTTAWRSANRFILDIDAVGGGMRQSSLAVNAPRLKNVRWTQFKPDAVRVVLDLTAAQMPRVLSSPPTDLIEVRITPPARTASDPVVDPAPPLAPPPDARPEKPGVSPVPKRDVAPDNPVPGRATIGVISVERGDDGRPLRVVVPTDEPVTVTPTWQDLHLVLTVPEAEPGAEQIVPLNDDVCLRARTSREADKALVIVDFTQRVNYAIQAQEDGNGFVVLLDLATPVTEPEPAPNLGTLAGKTIVVDAGHGGRDTGTRGPYVTEKTTNLDVALRLARVLTSRGAHVILTRSDDTLISLRRRPEIAMEANADAFVSIHCNYASANHHGIEVWHRRDDAESRRLSSYLYRADIRATGFSGRGVKPESRAPQGGLAVLKHNTVPCALVELGFVNDPVEGKAMASPEWRQKVAVALAGGLARFLERRS